jgi:hypothetical protein
MGSYLGVDESRQVLYVRFEGLVTNELFFDRYRQALDWNAVHGYPSGLFDCTGVTFFDVSTSAIRQVAAQPPVIPQEIRRTVVVVAPQDVIFGVARMFAILGANTRETLHVVRTMAEAYRLIGVESLDPHAVIEW